MAYAMQTAVTTATCIADFLSWEDLSGKEKVELGKLLVFVFSFLLYLFFSFFLFWLFGWFANDFLHRESRRYVPYLAVSVFMGLDMLGRLNAKLSSGRLVDGRLKKGN